MIAVIIGITLGFLMILLVTFLKGFDKGIIYGLMLAGIGFLYVGYTWSNMQELIINIVQAIVFFLLAYYGMKKSLYISAIGYFLHGSWDLAYNLIPNEDLLPPHYDLFCWSIDFTIGFYLLVYKYNCDRKVNRVTAASLAI